VVKTARENLYWSFHPSESYLALLEDLAELMELLGDWKGLKTRKLKEAGGIPTAT